MRKLFGEIAYHVLIALLIGFVMFPIYWMVLSSFRLEVEMFGTSPLFTVRFSTQNYALAIQEHKVGRAIFNSIIIAMGNLFLVMLVAVLSAYSLGRLSPKTGLFLKLTTFVLRMMPPVAMALPLFLIFKKAMAISPYLQLMLAHMVFNVPISIWLVQGFVADIPKELEESAMIDGCSRIGALFRIVLPLIAPGLLVTAALVFLYAWNEFLFGVILSTEPTKPITVVMAGYIAATGGIRYGQMFATGTLTILPTMVFGLLARKYFVKGITLGAVKG